MANANTRIETYRLVEYTSVQRGLPEARHERHFVDDGRGGLDYRLVVEYVPRQGIRSLFDRVLLKHAVRRALRETVSNLEARFASDITSTLRPTPGTIVSEQGVDGRVSVSQPKGEKSDEHQRKVDR